MERALTEILEDVAKQYPRDQVELQMRDVPRILFNICTVLKAAGSKSRSELELCDIGGGIGLFSVGCAACGVKRMVLVDDFDDPVNSQVGGSILDLHRRHGVEVVTRNVVDAGIDDIAGSFDVISSFGSMEHWHHSPKRLFHDIVGKLRPGGAFVLSAPNCVNMRKRITVPLGRGKWSRMQDWYEVDSFRGHVREPDVDDLIYIANDMQLTSIRTCGRNWHVCASTSPPIRIATGIVDHVLRLNPSLCSSIYMTGKTPDRE